MVRLANDNDFDFVKHSWEVCFDDTPEFVDWNFKFNYSSENTVIAEADGSPASVLQLIPYKMRFGDASLNSCYISGVATMPEHRGKGLVRELFDFAVPHMKSLGYDISILIPAVDGMYEKFGYRKVFRRTLYKADTIDGFEAYNTIDDKLINFVSEIYQKSMQKKSVYIKRSRTNFEKILTDLLQLSDGSVLLSECGYAFAYPKDGKYEICEVCGDIDVNAEPTDAPPVMARIINSDTITEGIFNGLIPNEVYVNMLL